MSRIALISATPSTTAAGTPPYAGKPWEALPTPLAPSAVVAFPAPLSVHPASAAPSAAGDVLGGSDTCTDPRPDPPYSPCIASLQPPSAAGCSRGTPPSAVADPERSKGTCRDLFSALGSSGLPILRSAEASRSPSSSSSL
eukprot:scaffold62833_cov18-Tisochrysis_lutea.AAC.5